MLARLSGSDGGRSTVSEAVEVSSGVTGPEDEREPEEDTEDDAQ